ncbi:MAG: DNA primase [bacterium]
MNDAELVKSKLDIVDIVAGYVELKKAGKDYRSRSPFREERTPSFFVSPDKQIWHDFGANEGGDMISFVMRAEGLSFPEALEMLATRAGVTLSSQPKRTGPDKQRLYLAMESAVKFYHLKLSRTPKALSYIKDQRGLTADTIRAFSIGYAPDDWSEFTDYALKQGFTMKELVSVGLSGQKAGRDTGYDLFRDRIMFPVYDTQGRPVGFSGRLLDTDAKAAKYINSPDTPIYHKARAIFGLKQAKASIRELNQVVVVEGHLDVISLWQHGQQNVVAVSGTALSTDQLIALGRMAATVKLCFDQDEAGIKATQRAIEIGSDLEARLEVISFKAAKDPDELIRSDPSSWKTAVDKSEYAIDYLVHFASEQFSVGSGEGNKQFTRFLLPTLTRLKDRVEQSHYMTQVAHIVGVQPEMLRETIEGQASTKSKSSTEVTQANLAPMKSMGTRQEQLEAMLMEMVVAYPDTRVALDDVAAEDFTELNSGLVALLKKQRDASLDQIINVLPDQEERVKMLSLRGEHEYSHFSEHERGLEAFTQSHTVQKHIYSLKKRALSRQLALAEQQRDDTAATRLLTEYQKLLEAESAFL